MFGASYYHGVLRKYIIMFGTMFNDIDVQRRDTNGNNVQTLRIPIAYGPKEKFLARLRSDPNLDKDVSISLPRMSFEIVSMNYDPTRKLPSTVRNTSLQSSDPNKLSSQYTPVPYNINISLSVYVKNADDGVQILEQILPFFGPEWTSQLKLIPELGLVYDIPTVFNDISTEDTYEGDFTTRRTLIHTLNFTIKGYIFGPVRTSGVIKRSVITTNIESPLDAAALSSTVEVTPGLTANGTPTSLEADSIDINSIQANSAFGYIEDITFAG